MHGIRHLGWFAVVAYIFFALTAANAGPYAIGAAKPEAAGGSLVLVKLGLADMSKEERKNLWKMVDEYATVDALQKFCGKNLNLQRRAWRAVAACVEVKSLRRVLSVFRNKKAKYLKAWEELHGEPEKKEALCKQFKTKLSEYSKIMSGQITEAANMCRNCFFC
jgi:hypothetical protein